MLGEQLRIDGFDDGERMMQQARDWARLNREAYWHMCMMATRYASQQRKFGIAELFEEVRWHLRIEGKTQGFKCNNTLRAPLARLMAQQYPSIAPYIETRKSKADMVL